jgi:replicative DNA helicase
MDIAAGLITRIANDSETMTDLIDQGVSSDLFVGEDKAVYEYCVKFYKEFGGSPSMESIETEFPDFDRWYNSREPTRWFVHELRRQFTRSTLLQITREVALAIKKGTDPNDILDAHVRNSLLKIDSLTSESTDKEWTSRDARLDRLRRYEEVKKAEGKVGIISPFPTLNASFQFRKEGLYIIVARQGVGKTWLLCALAHHAWKTEKAHTVIDSREMPIEQIESRLDSLRYGVSSDKIVRGDLDSLEEKKWRDKMEKEDDENEGNLMIVEETGGVSSDAAKLEKYVATSIWIDGGYMLPDERGGAAEWQQLTNVCRDLKRLAKRTKTVIVISLQFNREATNTEGSASNIALGDVAKEADGILGLFRSEDQKYNNRATLKVLKNRHSLESEPVELEWDLDRGIIKEVDRPIDYGFSDRSAPRETATTDAWSTWNHEEGVDF